MAAISPNEAHLDLNEAAYGIEKEGKFKTASTIYDNLVSGADGVIKLTKVLKAVVDVVAKIMVAVSEGWKLLQGACGALSDLVDVLSTPLVIKDIYDLAAGEVKCWAKKISTVCSAAFKVLLSAKLLENFKLVNLGSLSSTVAGIPVLGVVTSALGILFLSFDAVSIGRELASKEFNLKIAKKQYESASWKMAELSVASHYLGDYVNQLVGCVAGSLTDVPDDINEDINEIKKGVAEVQKEAGSIEAQTKFAENQEGALMRVSAFLNDRIVPVVYGADAKALTEQAGKMRTHKLVLGGLSAVTKIVKTAEKTAAVFEKAKTDCMMIGQGFDKATAKEAAEKEWTARLTKFSTTISEAEAKAKQSDGQEINKTLSRRTHLLRVVSGRAEYTSDVASAAECNRKAKIWTLFQRAASIAILAVFTFIMCGLLTVSGVGAIVFFSFVAAAAISNLTLYFYKKAYAEEPKKNDYKAKYSHHTHAIESTVIIPFKAAIAA